MESNITLKSNVYINKTASQHDADFFQHIMDYQVLKKYEDYGKRKMTELQKEILSNGQPGCSLEHGTMSWGVPVGSGRFVCRCEEYTCSYFSKSCSKLFNFEEIVRNSEDQTEGKSEPAVISASLYETDLAVGNEVKAQPLTENRKENAEAALTETISLESLESKTENSPIFQNEAPQTPESDLKQETIHVYETDAPARMDSLEEKASETQRKEAEKEDSSSFQSMKQEEIIHAESSARIWVNAGPGTGKTYTVIYRLKRLLSESMEKAILVLCFSRNAAQVIRDRLQDEMGDQMSSYAEDGRLIIRTFDSFASYMLDDELNPAWDYNRRIEEFIKAIARNPGIIDDMIGYLIVDEIQDIVGVRARMLLSILDEISCGALLLGDRCQAIYDWTVRDVQDMTFVQLSEELKKRKFACRELVGNRRQTQELALKSEQLREALLLEEESMQEKAVDKFKDWVQNRWSSYKIQDFAQHMNGTGELVLCKTNGDAAIIEQALFDSNVDFPFTMKRSKNHRALAGWIAKVLYGNNGRILEKEDFMANAKRYDVADPEEKWVALKEIDKHGRAPALHIPEVLAALSKQDELPAVCLEQNQGGVVVSTVHSAKGSEAKSVYWLNSPLLYENQKNEEGTLGDALKAAYVAATRAKEEIHLLDPKKDVYLKKIRDTRWIQIGLSKNKRIYCKGIALIPEDVDQNSFANDRGAEEIQELLANFEPGMPVELYANEEAKTFEIYCNGCYLGRMSRGFTEALFAGFEETNHTRNWPACIEDAYISAVVTVIDTGDPEICDCYRKAGCWLGVELSGFPRISWYN